MTQTIEQTETGKSLFSLSLPKLSLTFGGLGLAWLLAPVSTRNLEARPQPTTTYEGAVELYQKSFAGQETSGILPAATSKFYGHGNKTATAFLLIHGLTNCPAQFDKLGQELHEQGYNVVIPRMPRHGLQDQMSGAMKEITAEMLREYADHAVDIAAGLGEQLIVIGLSGGAVVAAWIAQFRPEVSKAVVLAPALGVIARYTFANYPLMRLVLRTPNFYTVRTEENRRESAPYVHFKRSSHAAAQFMRLGVAVQKAAKRQSAAATKIVVVTNAADTVVNNNLIRQLTRRWQDRNSGKVTTFEFEASLNLPHDLIDPIYKLQRTDYVYPILTKLALDGEEN